MKWFHERNDRFLNDPKVNCTFEEILAMSDSEFEAWCHLICDTLVANWDDNATPPVVGLNEEDIIDQFAKMNGFDSDKLWDTDELTGVRDVIRNKYYFGSAVNQFFPTMFKTRINTSAKGGGKSIYDFFKEPELFKSFYKSAIRNFKHDSFYHYSQCIRRENDVPTTSWIRAFEDDRGRLGGSWGWDYWLSPVASTKVYTGYNKDLYGAKWHTITEAEYRELESIIPAHCKSNVKFSEKKQVLQVRYYEKGQRLFPIGMKCFKIAYGRQVAVNFPPLIARALYERYTDHLDKTQPITIYDPSMGWAGRILGAMAVRDDRVIHYVGTDPNTDHNTTTGRTKYHEVADFFNSKTRANPIFTHKNTYRVFQLGSEVIGDDPDFQQYKGKIDLVFTSPPYFAKEVYSDDPEQSCHKFGQYEAWRDGFLEPTLKTAVEWLRNDRYLLWNIADAVFDGIRLPLEEDSRKILESYGMVFRGTVKMALASMPGANRLSETDEYNEISYNTLDGVVTEKEQVFSATTKNACKINGRVVKYEPIFVFWKP
jgi:hypothetical protein